MKRVIALIKNLFHLCSFFPHSLLLAVLHLIMYSSDTRTGEPPKKRTTTGDSETGLKKKNRGGYVCSRCGEPKKGHVCKIQPKYVRKDQMNEPNNSAGVEKETQAEIDEEMTVRNLDVAVQGTYDSYIKK